MGGGGLNIEFSFAPYELNFLVTLFYWHKKNSIKNNNYYPTLLRWVQITYRMSTNIKWNLYLSYSPDHTSHKRLKTLASESVLEKKNIG